MILSAANTYTGNTTVTAGTLELADNAQLKFVLGATSGVNNSLTGAGTRHARRRLRHRHHGGRRPRPAPATLENVTTLTGGAYGATFSVVGFTDAGSDTWTKTVGCQALHLRRNHRHPDPYPVRLRLMGRHQRPNRHRR